MMFVRCDGQRMAKTTTTLDRAIHLASKRAAAILCGWFELSPTQKADNGDRSGVSSLGNMMTARMIAEDAEPPSDIFNRLHKALSGRLSTPRDIESPSRIRRLISIEIDYQPNECASSIGSEVGVSARHWPNKSDLTIYINGSDRSCVWCDITEKRGYRADHVKHLLLPECMGGGWLVGPDVDDAYLEVVVEAVRAGRVAAATIKPE